MEAMATSREKTPLEQELQCLPKQVQRAFLPLQKHAMGVALGATSALALCVVNVVILAKYGEGKLLWLLANYCPGYDPDGTIGVIIGMVWVGAYGYGAGWLLTALRNRILAAYSLAIRARAQLSEDSDFLDQI